jgi:hypothetical protein
MPQDRICYTREFFDDNRMSFSEPPCDTTGVNTCITVLPDNYVPPECGTPGRLRYQQENWRGDRGPSASLPASTIQPAYSSDMDARMRATSQRDTARAKERREHGAATAAELRRDYESGKPAPASMKDREVPGRRILDPQKEEACREYAQRLVEQSKGKMSWDQAWAMAEGLYERTGGLMDKRPGKPDSPEERLAEIERQLNEMEAPGQREHEERAMEYAKRSHKRGESVSWADAMAATDQAKYSRRRTPTPDEVAAYATRVNGTGKRCLSFAEAEAELCGA